MGEWKWSEQPERKPKGVGGHRFVVSGGIAATLSLAPVLWVATGAPGPDDLTPFFEVAPALGFVVGVVAMIQVSVARSRWDYQGGELTKVRLGLVLAAIGIVVAVLVLFALWVLGGGW